MLGKNDFERCYNAIYVEKSAFLARVSVATGHGFGCGARRTDWNHVAGNYPARLHRPRSSHNKA